jgi:hypothetical protein
MIERKARISRVQADAAMGRPSRRHADLGLATAIGRSFHGGASTGTSRGISKADPMKTPAAFGSSVADEATHLGSRQPTEQHRARAPASYS